MFCKKNPSERYIHKIKAVVGKRRIELVWIHITFLPGDPMVRHGADYYYQTCKAAILRSEDAR